jgi:hypothetical protein
MISRGQMPFQISKPPEEMTNGKKGKNKKGRVLSQGQKSVQGLALGVRKRGAVQMPKGRGRKLGKLF